MTQSVPVRPLETASSYRTVVTVSAAARDRDTARSTTGPLAGSQRFFVRFERSLDVVFGVGGADELALELVL